MPIYSWHTSECPDSYREWCVLPINRDKLSDNNVKNNKQIAFFKENVCKRDYFRAEEWDLMGSNHRPSH